VGETENVVSLMSRTETVPSWLEILPNKPVSLKKNVMFIFNQ